MSDDDKLILGTTKDVPLAGLTDEQKRVIKEQHAKGLVNANSRAAMMAAENAALRDKLEQFTDHAQRATQLGHSAAFHDTHKGEAGISETTITSRSKRDMAIFYAIVAA